MPESGPRVAGVRLAVRDVPLRTPYVLSFVTLASFRARLVAVDLDDGRRGLGEVVALPGYGAETDAAVAEAHAALAARLPGLAVDAARASVVAAAEAAPFAASAVLAALDVATGRLAMPPRIDQPLVGGIETADPAVMLEAMRRHHDAGVRTIKVKFGRDPEADRRAVAPLLDAVPQDSLLRFDANQAYDEAAAMRVLAAFDHPRRDRVELFEQPMGVDETAWEAMPRLVAASPVPLMLDEAILADSDIDRAATVGAAWVKLKACKGAGVDELLGRARRAKAVGLRVVLGNGVATDIANLFEAAVRAAAPELFDGAGEHNGFTRIATPLLRHPPRPVAGHLRWEPPAGDGEAFAIAEPMSVG
jgi:L-alanine-DL-glutamate epimerase-like enolase superfamily enzyme